MMNDTPTRSWQPKVNKTAAAQEESAVDMPFYTLLRQQGMTVDFLNICFRDGNQTALPTASILKIDYQPERQAIMLLFRFALLTITGRNLIELYKQLIRLKVAEIREYPKEPDKDFGVNDLFITNIQLDTEAD